MENLKNRKRDRTGNHIYDGTCWNCGRYEERLTLFGCKSCYFCDRCAGRFHDCDTCAVCFGLCRLPEDEGQNKR